MDGNNLHQRYREALSRIPVETLRQFRSLSNTDGRIWIAPSRRISPIDKTEQIGKGVPETTEADCRSDMAATMHEQISKIAACTERLANSIEAIAAHAHMLESPMTVQQVAEYAHVRPKTVYDWKAKGWIKPLADNAKPLLFDQKEVRSAVCRIREGR